MRARVALAVALAGVAAGVGAGLLTLLLHAVAHLALGGGESYAALAPWRRVVTAVGSAVVAALGWWGLRRYGAVTSLDAVRRDPTARMSLRRNAADAVITVVAVGSGMAVGRETAPRQVAAATAEHIAGRLGVTGRSRVELMSAASAAGLAAVYNAPLAGIAYCCEVVARAWSWRSVAFALPACAVGTVVAWPVVGSGPNLPFVHGDPALWWWGLPVGVVAATIGPLYARLTGWGRDAAAPRGPRLVASLAVIGLALGLATLVAPHVTGNGRAVIGAVLRDDPQVLALLAMLALKPLLTTGFLRAGAVGGVLAPALALGACAGALTAHAAGQPGLAPSLAVVCAGALLSVTQAAPLFGPLLALEMTHPPVDVVITLAVATLVAQLLVRAPAALGRRSTSPAQG